MTTEILEPKYRVYIDGSLRRNVNVVSFVDRVGIAPSELTLHFPDAEFNQNVVRRGQIVKCEMFRGGFEHKFYGQVFDISNKYSHFPGVSFLCKDWRHILNRDVVRRDYNVLNRTTDTIEEFPAPLTIRAIVTDIIIKFVQRHAVDHPEYGIMKYDLSSIPDDIPAIQQSFLGSPISTVLETVANEHVGGLYNWMIEYHGWTPRLKLVPFNSSSGRRDYRYGTNPEVSIIGQPYGPANVNEVDQNENVDALETQIIVLGGQVREQRLLKLRSSWTFTRNLQSFVIEGHYFGQIPDPNPDRLTEPQIIAMFLNMPDRFLKKDMRQGVINNPHYNPDMGYIGKKFAIEPHLLWDVLKYEDQSIVDSNSALREAYFSWLGQPGITVPGDALNYCTYKVPEIESELFVLPLDRSGLDEDYQPQDSTDVSIPFIMARYYLDIQNVLRVPYLAEIYALNPFDPVLLWTIVTEGISIRNKKSEVVLEDRLVKSHSLLDFLRWFPSVDQANAVAYPDIYNPKAILKPCIMDAPDTTGVAEREWTPEAGLTKMDITWPDIVTLLDSITDPDFLYYDEIATKEGAHFLRYFSIPPDHWGIDVSSEESPKPITQIKGAWSRLWDEIGFDGDDTVIFTTNILDEEGSPRIPPSGYKFAALEELQRFYFYELPYEVYLNAVAVDTRRAYYNSGPVVESAIEKITVVENSEFERKRLGAPGFYGVDYRSELLKSTNLPANEIDKINLLARLGEAGVEVQRYFLDPAVYESGYDLVNDGDNRRQTNPPIGVLHIGEGDIPALAYNPNNSKMGKFGLSKLSRTNVELQSFTIRIEAMDFIVRLGMRVFLNGSRFGNSVLRVTEIQHEFYGGDPKAKNVTFVKVSIM